MPYYLRLGSIPPKRHIRHPASPGYRGEGIHYEEVITTQGFGRAYSIVYHLRPPTRVRRIEPAGVHPIQAAKQDTLRHVHLKTGGIPPAGDPITGRVTISRCRPASPQRELYRNARSEELIFVHAGKGTLWTQFGALPFRPMDYIMIPKCTTYSMEFDTLSAPLDLLVVESHGDLGFPPRYLNPDGQFRLGAPICERDLHGPNELRTIDREEDTSVLIKDGDCWTRYILANHPFDVAGWDGMVYPFTFNADDFEPITGTIHQPPPIHQTFQASGFVVCTFAPRMLDTHPMAIKVPYAHSNVESDEVLYYVRGQFGSRRGVELGSMTLHPHGIPHGPHPGTIEASRDMLRTDELAVMVDTFRPLQLAEPCLAMEDTSYPFSWLDE
jgi:homogentisate 1,2-dioxygenase